MTSCSREVQFRIDELKKEEDLFRNYGYAYDLLEKPIGLRVTDWGRPSKFIHTYSRDGLAIEAASWEVFWVTVCVRDFADLRIGGDIGSGWYVWVRYPTKAFVDIDKLFKLYLGTCGLYKRVRYDIEDWEWSEPNGWEPVDHV